MAGGLQCERNRSSKRLGLRGNWASGGCSCPALRLGAEIDFAVVLARPGHARFAKFCRIEWGALPQVF